MNKPITLPGTDLSIQGMGETMKKLAIAMMVALVVNAPLALATGDPTTICTSDGKCYSQCIKESFCIKAVDNVCIVYWGKQSLNVLAGATCTPDVATQCYSCLIP